MLDVKNIKKDFPILNQQYNSNPIVYLDNAATSQKPLLVIDAISNFYKTQNANVGRSSHFLADIATQAYEGARQSVAAFLGVSSKEIIFTKNSTEALNLVAFGWAMRNLTKDDVILTTSAEHNSSLLPFIAVAKATGAKIEYIKVDENGSLDSDWRKKFENNVKIVVLTHVSNVLGVELPITQIAHQAKQIGAKVVVDGSQAISKFEVRPKSLGCDFYAFSGHKMLGPMGIGVLWGNIQSLKDTYPISFGGGIVNEANIEQESLLEIPGRFESGTPNVAGAVGLEAAIKYLNSIGIQNAQKHDKELLDYAFSKLNNIDGIQLLGPKTIENRSGLISFYISGVHSHDIASILSSKGIAVRAGLHCSMKLFDALNLPSATRISFQVYNTKDDVDAFVNALEEALLLLR